MASTITISSQNLNGFARNEGYVRGLCDRFPNTIRAVQEHWLKPPAKKFPGVNKLGLIHEEFDGWGTSAMRSSMEKEVTIGRPFGGTGFIWNKKYSLAVKPRLDYKHERVTVLELNSNDGRILLINAYMPYYKANNVIEQTALYSQTLTFIDTIMEMNPECSFILLSDLNCNIYDTRHSFSTLIRDLMLKRNLVSTYDTMNGFDPLSTWTRMGKRANGATSKTLIDYILVSRPLLSRINNVRVSEYPDNLSDHLPVEIDLRLDLDIFEYEKRQIPKCVNWKKVKDKIRDEYESVMENELNSIYTPRLLHDNALCDNCDHINLIENYYCDIMKSVTIADSVLPRSSPTIQRDFWDDDLKRLKSESIDAYEIWKDDGRPVCGPIFELKKSAHYRYKLYLRKCQKEFDQARNDDLHSDLLNRDTMKFWHSWKSIHGSGQTNATRIEGNFKNDKIADCFADSFESVYSSNDRERASDLKAKFDHLYSTYKDNRVNEDLSRYTLSWPDMLNILEKIKTGKAAAGHIRYEHILLGSPKLIVHLQILFNAMIIHGYVPRDFLLGVITPVVKDNEGDLSSTSNYRGLTLSVPFASLFEHAMLLKIGDLLHTSHLQFGYKPKHSASHALYILRSCIEYFTEHGSNVCVAFLDCSKGFDKVDHHGIFIKLMQRNVPLCILNVIMYWYLNLVSVVKWNGIFSRTFQVTSGVRQGGILSPRLFTIYVDDLLLALRNSGVGCHIVDKFLGAIMYADDLALLAPTRSSLQKLLNICQEYGIEWCITYNTTKTTVMIFGRSTECQSLFLNDSPIRFVTEYKYLGIWVIAGTKFLTSARKPLTTFYCIANTILNILHKPSEQIMMHLLYSNCVPGLTYACEIRRHSSDEMQKMNTAVNDCIRRIFSYNRWESTRFLRNSFGYDSITNIFAKRSASFDRGLRFTGNPILMFLKSLKL